ncbi:MAG: hypothetical protein HY016_09970 [Nitrosomonadales bacterium]|nr:hypothetical protein [Nitrosomonadales bacterium]
MEKPSVVERIAGSLATKAGATWLAATAPPATLVAIFIPLLGDTLAFGRYQERIGKSISMIEADLTALGARIENLTDAQFKFINETILTILQTLEEEKLAYLRSAVLACVSTPGMTHKEASVISRVIRDISADEIRLLVSSFQYRGVVVSIGGKAETASYSKDMVILQKTPDSVMLVSGLISLGLLELDDNVFGNTYSFTPTVSKLLALVGGR